MSDLPAWTVVAALIAASGGWLTARVRRKSGDHARIQALENRVDRVEARNVQLWLYNRELVDHIYEGKPAPPPPMPSTLIKLMETS